MADFLLGEQVINGKKGQVNANIDGLVRTLIEVSNITASVTLDKKEIKVLGNIWTQHKVIGVSGSGSMDMNFVTSDFRNMVLKYIRTGIMPPLTLTINVNDPASGRGAQNATLQNVILDDIDIAKLNADDVLNETLNFTYSGISNFKSFNALE